MREDQIMPYTLNLHHEHLEDDVGFLEAGS
jgi:hypothetical protein